MQSIVNDNFRIYSAQKFLEGLLETALSTNNLYLWIGKVTPWNNESEPDSVNDTVASRIGSFADMLAMIKVSPSRCSLVIPRHNWTSGTVYTAYDWAGRNVSGTNYDLSSPLVNTTPFYVLTTDNNIYKCISNNLGTISSVMPTGSSTELTLTGDGYIWKFMYQLNSVQDQNFLNTDWIPIATVSYNDGSLQYQTQQTAVNGTIDAIIVDTPGSAYSGPPQVVIAGDGTGAQAIATIGDGAVTQIIMLTRGQNYTYANITFIDVDPPPNTDYTYYIDPNNGNDANPGTAWDMAFRTTTFSDSVTLTGLQSVGYAYAGTWYLYRSLDMTADEAQLAADLVSATADNF